MRGGMDNLGEEIWWLQHSWNIMNLVPWQEVCRRQKRNHRLTPNGQINMNDFSKNETKAKNCGFGMYLYAWDSQPSSR
jgi:hypothetical protein